MGKLEKIIVENGITYVLGEDDIKVQTWVLYEVVVQRKTE